MCVWLCFTCDWKHEAVIPDGEEHEVVVVSEEEEEEEEEHTQQSGKYSHPLLQEKY